MINIDFQILETCDPKVISIADYSNWEHIENKPSIVEITLPGCKNPVVHYFQKRSINIFNSLTLDVNCNGCDSEMIPLEDGVYTVTVKGSPDSFSKTKTFLRTTNTELQLDKLFINSDLLCNKPSLEQINRLFEIQFLLKAAKANVKYDNICRAQELLFKAQEMIENTENCSPNV